MTSTTAAAPAPLNRVETGALLGQTMGLVALTAGLFALGAYIGRDTSGGWAILWFVAAFAVLLGINAAAQRSEQLAVGLLFGFGLLLGLAVAPTVGYYVGADPQAVWEAGGATALCVAGFGAAGYATRRDLSRLARSLFWAAGADRLRDRARLRPDSGWSADLRGRRPRDLCRADTGLIFLSLFGGDD